MNQSPSKSLAEIVTCRSAVASLRAHSTMDEHGRSVQRWSQIDVWPRQGRQLCVALASAIAKLHRLDPTQFQIHAQTWEDTSAERRGYFHSGWVLLICADAVDQVTTDKIRRDASKIVQLLGGKPLSTESPTVVNAGLINRFEPESSLNLDDLNGEPLLGVKISVPLVVEIVGHATTKLTGLFRRTSARKFTSAEIQVTGRITGAKFNGRTRCISVAGFDDQKQAFSQTRIRFDESLRGQIATAIGKPTATLQMQISVEQSDVGRAKPRVKYVLSDMQIGV